MIARNSTFAYKGRAVDVQQVGRELGVRYVLEGSVRKAGSRVRITAQLIDAATGAHVWAERYDRALDDIFAVQDEITLERRRRDRAEAAPRRDRPRQAQAAREPRCLRSLFARLAAVCGRCQARQTRRWGCFDRRSPWSLTIGGPRDVGVVP